jgi:hypothetical protein
MKGSEGTAYGLHYWSRVADSRRQVLHCCRLYMTFVRGEDKPPEEVEVGADVTARGEVPAAAGFGGD